MNIYCGKCGGIQFSYYFTNTIYFEIYTNFVIQVDLLFSFLKTKSNKSCITF